MNKKLLILSLTVVLMFGVLIASASSQSYDNQIVDGLNCTSDLNQALSDAQSQNKNVMLVFDQEGCYYCDLIKEDTFSDGEVQGELSENYIICVVDINQQPNLASQYQVFGTPYIVFLDSNSQKLGEITGYVPADEFLDALKEI